jgi:hypothetical protein
MRRNVGIDAPLHQEAMADLGLRLLFATEG